ncbi:hypothetical protein OIU85_018356 [Salix viminalis]|uniref:Uncharacterized protein n=1 Tax=Salix viminalis TaxID=40686 RepID=A0A9Q0UU43_SALVM|nr:hypothetical protein OIU85_018356 [Salix viminalis]
MSVEERERAIVVCGERGGAVVVTMERERRGVCRDYRGEKGSCGGYGERGAVVVTVERGDGGSSCIDRRELEVQVKTAKLPLTLLLIRNVTMEASRNYKWLDGGSFANNKMNDMF